MPKKNHYFSKWATILPFLVVCLLLCTTSAMALTDDLTDDFMFPNYPSAKFCPVDTQDAIDGVPGFYGDTAAVWADVDGLDDGDPLYGRYEVMVVISTVRGEMYAVPDSSGIKQLFYSFFEVNCGEPNCSVDDTCDRGRLVMRFVDLRGAGVVWDNPATWAGNYIGIEHVAFTMSADYCYDYNDPKFDVTPPYYQARAYRAIDLTDYIGACDGGYCEFNDPSGVAEVFISTDYCENNLDDLMLDGTAIPFNTPTGSNVTVSVANATITYDTVTGAGNTSVTESSTGTAPPPNFALCDPSIYYNIETTATYTGSIEVCINYPESCSEPDLRLLHEEGGVWVDTSTSIDTINHIICGEVSGFSAFIIGAFEEVPECVCPGDANGDGMVDITDVDLLRAAIGTSAGEPGFNLCADLDDDGRITVNDYRLLRSLYGTMCGS